MSWLIYKTKVVGTYTFIYAQKVWGLLPISFLFAVSQVPLMNKYKLKR